MGIIDRIVTKLTDKAVEKYSDEMPQRTMWLVVAAAALVAAFLSGRDATKATEQELRDAAAESLTDDDVREEYDRRKLRES